jgi:hypothetical protein
MNHIESNMPSAADHLERAAATVTVAHYADDDLGGAVADLGQALSEYQAVKEQDRAYGLAVRERLHLALEDERGGAWGAIQAELEANPQLVPKTDVPQRLLRATLRAIDAVVEDLRP